MKNLKAYVESKNQWNALFGTAPMTFPLSQSNANSLMDSIACELSPENLHCDGEASVTHVRAKTRQLNSVRNDLETYCLNNWLNTPECVYQGLTHSQIERIMYTYKQCKEGNTMQTTKTITLSTVAQDPKYYTVEDLATIMGAAKQAAHDAAMAHLAQHGEHAYCGFAWVNIYGIKGNTKLGRAMKQAGYEKDYTGAYSIWNPSGLGTQCMSTKEAGAQAAAAVFKACGFTAYAGSRAD